MAYLSTNGWLTPVFIVINTQNILVPFTCYQFKVYEIHVFKMLEPQNAIKYYIFLTILQFAPVACQIHVQKSIFHR